MVTKIKENLFLYNAPAGSGKTTTLKKMIMNFHLKNPEEQYLCITFTNRAADEMKDEHSSEYVFSSTIHTFLSDFIKPYLELPEVIDLYFLLFKESIQERINNESNKYTSSLEKYRIEYNIEEISFELVRLNVKKLLYSETPFSSYLRGTLSHDDLINFACALFEKYPLLKKRITSNFSKIFIDEYQDTDEKVLYIFYNSVLDTICELYLFGDLMQQIYSSNNLFLQENSCYFQKINLNMNYRSSKEIVSCLNNIYNSEDFTQTSYIGESTLKPKIIISTDYEKDLNEILLKEPDLLELHLLNRDKYKNIGCENLYNSISKLERYKFGSKYSATDVLSKIEDNPDWLMNIFFKLEEMKTYFFEKNYGKVLELYKANSFFNKKKIIINVHSDKRKVYFFFDNLFKKTKENINIKEILLYLFENEIIVNFDYSELFLEYDTVLKCMYCEIEKIHNYIQQPKVSTQHGVKGESHESVVFISTDANTTPYVSISTFFKLFALGNVKYNEFEYQCRDYNLIIQNKHNNDDFLKSIIEFKNKYQGTLYYEVIGKSIIDSFIKNPNKTNFNKLSSVLYDKVFVAYKLFYVGCSRARKKLYVMVKKQMIADFEKEFILKMKSIGFELME